MTNVIYIPVNQLTQSKYNPRLVRDPEKLKVLAESVKREGMKYPLLVKKGHDNVYEVLDGSRRLEVAKDLGLEEVPCKLEEGDEKTVAKNTLRLHLSQEDLTIDEIVNAIKRYIAEGVYESEKEACKDLNISYHTYLEWKKKTREEERIKIMMEKAGIPEDAEKILLNSNLNKEYVKEIVDIIKENPDADVKQLVNKFSEATVREIGENEYEARGEYLYRLRQSGRDIVFEMYHYHGTTPVHSTRIPKSDLIIVKQLFKKVK